MTTETKPLDVKGGLDLVKPPAKRPGGLLQAVQNFRNDQDSGITLVGGYDRFDGKAGPSEITYWIIPFDQGIKTFVAGNEVEGGTSGTVATVVDWDVLSGDWSTCDAAGNLFVYSLSGTFLDDEEINPRTGEGFSNGFSSGFELEKGTTCYSKYLAVGITSAPFLDVFDLDANRSLGKASWTPMAIASDPPGDVYGVVFSPDRSKLVCCHAVSPYLTIYNTSTWAKHSSPPAVGASSNAAAAAFTSDGTKLAILHNNGITVYNSSDADPANWTVITTNISTTPGYTSSFSPKIAFGKNDTLLAAPDTSTPYVHIWNVSDWSKVSDPATLPDDLAFEVNFSNDGAWLAVAHDWDGSSKGLSIYNTTTWARTVPAALESGLGSGIGCMDFSKDGSVLAVMYNGNGDDSGHFLSTTDWSDLTQASTGAPEISYDMAYSRLDEFIAFNNSSALYIWDVELATQYVFYNGITDTPTSANPFCLAFD